MTAPEGCGSHREWRVVPSRCDSGYCAWPDCLHESEQKHLRPMLDGQLEAKRARWAADQEDAA